MKDKLHLLPRRYMEHISIIQHTFQSSNCQPLKLNSASIIAFHTSSCWDFNIDYVCWPSRVVCLKLVVVTNVSKMAIFAPSREMFQVYVICSTMF